MTEMTRQRLIYAVFAAAVLWGLYMQPWKRKAPDAVAPAPAEAATPAVVEVASAAPASAYVALPPNAEWTVDPFHPSAPRESDGTEAQPSVRNAPVLQGVMMVRGNAVCVIDGQLCKTGDRSGSWTIVAIGDGEVTLIGPDQERVMLNTNDNGQRK